MNSKNKIIEYFNSLPEVARIKELEHYIDNNEKIKKAFNELKDIQKKMVASKEYNQINQYKIYKIDYENKRCELYDLPFVEEYLELLEYVDNLLIDFTNKIEEGIEKKING